MASVQNKDSNYWLEVFSKTDLPVLGGIVNKLDAVTRNDTSSALQLADVILKDPSLTSRVLKVANCVFYNPAVNNPITTISRAVVQLGIAGIKSIYASVVLVDQLLKNQPHPHLIERIVHAINAAVQARNLIQHLSGKVNEEVFIAALLYHLGEMAFWCFGAEQATRLSEMMEQENENPEVLTERLLGTNFHTLSSGLAERWELGRVLKEVLQNPSSDKPDTAAVLLGDRLTEALKLGQDSAEFQARLEEVTEFCNLEIEDALALVERGSNEAASELSAYGVDQLHKAAKASQASKQKIPPLSPDPQLQLNMLRDLDTMVNDKCDINSLFHTVVEGIHRGVGLERVAIALCDPQRTKIQAKYVLGDNTAGWREALAFPITEEHCGALMQCAVKRQPTNIGSGAQSVQSNTQEQKLFGNVPALAAPILAGDRLLGVFYADRNGRFTLSEEQRSAFQYIVRQANLSLEKLLQHRSR